jgi:hypothetical protein
MQLGTVKKGLHWLTGTRCKPCKRLVRTGDVVLAMRLNPRDYGEDRVVFHVTCMERFIREKPHDRPLGTDRGRRSFSPAHRQLARDRALEALVRRYKFEFDELVESELTLLALGGE